MTFSLSELLSPARVALDLNAADGEDAIRAVTALLADDPAGGKPPPHPRGAAAGLAASAGARSTACHTRAATSSTSATSSGGHRRGSRPLTKSPAAKRPSRISGTRIRARVSTAAQVAGS